MVTVDWGQAVVIFVLGMVTVFVVLILLLAILKLMAVGFGNKQTTAPVQTPSAPATPAATLAGSATTDDSELIAVLTAAVAASLNTPACNLRIRNYRKLGSPASVWNSVSRRENIDSQIF